MESNIEIGVDITSNLCARLNDLLYLNFDEIVV